MTLRLDWRCADHTIENWTHMPAEDTDVITVELTIAAPMLKMRTLDHVEQLTQDDALASLLGRAALALARRQLLDRV